MTLDIFRGLAALLMVYNHAGFAWLANADAHGGWSGQWIFLTGMAPVLFFLATGVGMGWSGRSQPMSSSVWRKAGLLILADVLLNWGQGVAVGLNFFGFIAIAMLVLAGIRSTRHVLAWSCGAILLLLMVRFLPSAAWKQWAQVDVPMAIVTGIAPVDGVSYPLSPWMIYPVLGLLLAWSREWWSRRGAAMAWAALALASALAAAGAAVLASRGAVFHRWGTMSAAYLVVSLAVLGAAWGLARVGAAFPAAARALALRGPASLLVVPLHYGVIGLAEWFVAPPMPLGAWCVTATVLTAVIIVASRRLAAFMSATPLSARSLGLLLAASTAATWASHAAGGPALLTLCLACVGQVLVAWELSRPDVSPRR